MRKVVLDTETTGTSTADGHKIIEIGAVELVGRRPTGNQYHQYINPEREVDYEATQVHGFTWDDLRDKPTFDQIADEFLAFIHDAELVIHNAPFDMGFINAELMWSGRNALPNDYPVIDTLPMAKQRFPGQRASLDALCNRFGVDRSQRTLHGALLDAQLLQEVYIALTAGQHELVFASEAEAASPTSANRQPHSHGKLRVLHANEAETAQHQEKINKLLEKSGRNVWGLPEPKPETS